MKYRQAREIAEDVMVDILDGFDPRVVKGKIYDIVFKERGADELVQRLVYDQFRQTIERMRRHVRGPAPEPRR
jgi:hypothetical protein